MKRFLATIFVAVLFFFGARSSAAAQSEFIIDVNVNYDVDENGITKVTHTITLENAYSDLYATSYTLNLENIKPKNASAREGEKLLSLSEKREDSSTSLEVRFDEAVVGKGKKRTFSITFDEESFAQRTGEVWEISIPRISQKESFRVYTVNLLIPIIFGNKAYMAPDPDSVDKQGQKLVYNFGKEAVASTGITAAFGDFQVFSFTLKYHLENPLSRQAITQIAIPPDTAFQKVYYQSLKPEPDDVFVDEDGNWLASYSLKSRERIDIVAVGSVQIFASPWAFPNSGSGLLEEYTKETEFWQSNDAQIRSLAGKLKTPRAIYDYVTDNLTYNNDRVRPNVERMGAKAALNNPDLAICMEFTDLFIALARAAGIPAREINGYAYSENPILQPLSLVADVLHAWPEYWDKEKAAWIPVDPTWGSTTGGVDYFTKLDLRHFTFVIHGKDPRKPFPPGSYKLGPNPEKDVFVNFGQLPKVRTGKPEIEAEIKGGFLPTSSKLKVKIKNSGPTAFYNVSPTIYFDTTEADSTFISTFPPYSSQEIEVKIPFSFLGRKTPEKITVVVADARLTIPSNKNQVIIYNLLVLSFVFSVTIGVVFVRVKKINLGVQAKSLFGRIKPHAKKHDQPLSP